MGGQPIARVVLKVPLAKTFDYLIPDDCLALAQPGHRVRVPFGKQEKVGVIYALAAASDVPVSQLKSLSEVLDEAPLLSSSLLRLLTWISTYYSHPLGDVVLSALPRLIREGRVLAEPTLTEHLGEAGSLAEPALPLNADQSAAYDALVAADAFSVFCLEGVTGSGKTEVYLQAIDYLVQRGLQALVLVPEISLTAQTVTRFERRFSAPLGVLHSGLTEREKHRTWSACARGELSIVIGTRSAMLAPMPRLGIIVIDESHDASFKQQSGCRYSARDVGIFRAKQLNIPIVLGSATPSLETLSNLEKPYYHHVRLPVRAGGGQMPAIEVIDLKEQALTAGLSPALIDALRATLAAGQQVLLFLNRRGYAPAMLCHSCAEALSCRQCDATLTLHQALARVACHHCGLIQPIPSACPSCKLSSLSPVGVGTEQIESALQALFPDEQVLRIDRDSTRKKGQLAESLAQAASGEARILIGTQMLAKGHHFPQLTLVAIVDADSGFYSADFRAMERLGQLITQVAGRAGREAAPGRVYIQTHLPEHPHLQVLLEAGYSGLSKHLLSERASYGLPPYAHWVLVHAESKQQKTAENFLCGVVAGLNKYPIALQGPVSSPMGRRAGRFRMQLLLSCQSRPSLRQAVDALPEVVARLSLSTRVRWFVDVDPQDIA
jgi:primosomal protein N' (replication factor Y)